ncbi:MAG: hypothetical protein ABI435_01525 [Pseudolysinimonas sp.]
MFETYEKGATKAELRPDVTILRKGSLHMNRAARRLLGDADFVELLYDEPRRVIGLRPSTQGTTNAYKLSAVRDILWTVSLIAFLKFYGIEVLESRRRIPYLEGNILCVNLNEPGIVVDRRAT